MLPVPTGMRVWLATGHTDMRKGFPGLSLIVQETLKKDPHVGHLSDFRWVNTLLGNMKTAIAGTCRAVRRKYAGLYLAGFEYRFNRRFDLPAMIEDLARAALAMPPQQTAESYR